ncbi:hypothetical protein SAMN05421676_11525 [Salinibacillus kushneri]|uniref:Uncharacterized protein n=1 Tax=Salinibacillus kushneri TaxID=237682 RepID=A0A1I0J0V5_9BACI|nr:hypothetical protein [Salinibacillus kushneri]SEU03083.1 hypothetical protein SAMN05421676_11525 [Salinibacillus kushneri]
MGSFLLELSLLGILIIGLTAFSAVIVQFLGEKIFGRKTKSLYSSKSRSIQSNWKQVGGNHRYRQ